MENASKALIIAGAILLAIVLVSLGVLVINNARGDIEDKNIDQATIDAFNSKLTAYMGRNKSGTDLNNLIDAISASNGAQTNKADKHYIGIDVSKAVVLKEINKDAETKYTYGYAFVSNTRAEFEKDDAVYQRGYPTFSNSEKYQVSANYDEAGYIVEISISGDNS